MDDGVSSGTHAGDLDDQGTNNYLYDDAGNLISDAQSTATISWTAYGKVREVERTDIDQKTRFGYDAGQNRVAKAVIDVSATDTLYTYYVRDAQGNVMAVYERQEDTLIWQEQHLYGSARLGILQPGVRWYPGNMPTPNPYFTDTTTLCEGWKYYEITNHLGNVMATINDRKAQFDTDSDDVADYYEAAVMTATDYFPFGAPMRQYQASDYRYGFNGKETEHDGEFAATVHYDYGFRVYHPAVGRFLSVDPLSRSYPELTPYQFASNSPIAGVDLDGLEFFFAANGSFLGKWSLGKNKNVVVVVNQSEVKRFVKEAGTPIGMLNLAIDYEHSKIEGHTLPAFNLSGETEKMTIDHLLDLAHIVYGEAAGKQEYNLLAHLLMNREIKFSKLVPKVESTPMGLDQKTGEKIYPTADDVDLLKYTKEYGFRDYVLFGTHMPYNETALKNFKKTLRETGIQEDAGVQNNNYLNFFEKKSDVKGLLSALPAVTDIFKAIFNARLGKTADPYPNHEGWRGVVEDKKRKSDPRNEVPNVKSDD